MSTRRCLSFAWMAIGIIAGLSGCATWTKSSSEKSWNPKTWFKKEYQEPASMATIWRADRFAEPGQREERGFGARVYFYNEKSQAIPVEGELTVHGYLTTASSRREPREQPDKKYTFTAEQLAGQFSPSDLGASYSIWIPWDEDGLREEVTLIATFKSKKGNVVQGSPTKTHLPGKSPVADEKPHSPHMQQVSFSKSTMSTYNVAPNPEQMLSTRVTTIDLPKSSTLNRPQTVSVGQTQPHGSTSTTNSTATSLGDATGIEVGGVNAVPGGSQGGFSFQPLPPAPVHPGTTSASASLGPNSTNTRPPQSNTIRPFGPKLNPW